MDMGQWVTAVRNALAGFDDEAVPVALALAEGKTSVEGLSQSDFDSEVDYLCQCGFLVDEFSVACDHDHDEHDVTECHEHSLAFAIPE